ncbi:MAG TPA: hypothetical protein VHM66_04600 [Solirubrobacterales bacterium]|nr:hypothetical protein [Solirubrobacterales bacterium]
MFAGHAIEVLTFESERIAALDAFISPRLPGRFGLPAELRP